jgi:hypothetical protein
MYLLNTTVCGCARVRYVKLITLIRNIQVYMVWTLSWGDCVSNQVLVLGVCSPPVHFVVDVVACRPITTNLRSVTHNQDPHTFVRYLGFDPANGDKCMGVLIVGNTSKIGRYRSTRDDIHDKVHWWRTNSQHKDLITNAISSWQCPHHIYLYVSD